MLRLSPFIRQYIRSKATPRTIIIAVAIFIIVIISLISIGQLMLGKKTAIPAEPKPQLAALTPGLSRHQDLIDELGVPQDIYQHHGYFVYTYPSTTAYYTPDQFYLKDDLLFLKEVFYTPQQYLYPQTRVINVYGKPSTIYYLPYSPYINTHVYYYPRQGLAVYINQNDQAYRFHYFNPNQQDLYLQEWGKDFLTDPPVAPSTHKDSSHPHP